MASSLTPRRPYEPGGLIVGALRGEPGGYAYGTLEALTLPTGGAETFPIIIAQGHEPGPVLWLTASIHGDEYTGIRTISRSFDTFTARAIAWRDRGCPLP